MRQFIRHRQGIIHAITPNNGNTRFLKGAHFARGGGIVGALYNYQENAAQPPAGSIYHSSGANSLKINVIDANGINHQSAIQNLRAGDKITIGTQSSYLTGTPGITSGVALVLVQSWPNYTNGQYSVTVEKGVLPYTTVAPAISGSNLIGSTLTCTPGTWAGKPTPSPAVRQWKADGINISGQTGLTYVIAAGDAGKNITCVETATSLTGTASSSSNQIFAGITPTNITAPTVTGEGTPGEVLTCGNGTWVADPAATYTKQWRRDGSNISGQTSNTYTVLAGDVGKIITCAVTATNTIAAVTAISNGILVTAEVGNPPVNTSAPVISGSGSVGSILSLTSQGTWTGTPPISYTYQWQRDGANTGNTGNSYVVQAGDAGLTITCRVTGTNVDGVTNASSNGILCSPPVFSPASLFASGEQGAWLDPSDLTTMFQDRAGTIQVTADGQPVGKILDKSGRGNHATAPSDAARPLYKTSGGLHWLQFDGVDDNLQTASINLSSVKQLTIFTGDSIAVVTGWLQVFQFGLGVTTTGSFGLYMPFGGTNASMFALPSSASANQSASWTNSGVNVNEVLAISLDNPAATRQIVARKNASEVAALNGSAYDSGFSNALLTVSANGAPSEFSPCSIYSLIVRGALSTTQEIADTETWVAAKTGVTLP